MHRIRLLVAVVVVAVMATSCGGGGGDTESAGQADSASDEAADRAVSETAQNDQRDTEDDAVAGIEPAPVRLGDRFAWCADVQSAWDSNLDGLQAALETAAAFNDAVAAHASAVDELDRAAALEQMNALEGRADDLIDRYVAVESSDTRPGIMSAFLIHIGGVHSGVEGTQGVAYAQALDAFGAAASPQDAALFDNFLAILRPWRLDEQEHAEISALELPPAVEAAFAISAAETAQQGMDFHIALSAPTLAVPAARSAVRSVVSDTGYDYKVPQAVANVASRAVYAHLLDPDIRPTDQAWLAEATDYESTLQLAHDTAVATFRAVFDAETANGNLESWQLEEAERRATDAARDAARPIIEDDLAAMEAASVAAHEVFGAALDAASDETNDAIRALNDQSRAAFDDANDSHRYALGSTLSAINNAASDDAWAAMDATEAAANDTLYTQVHQAVAESAAVARSHDLAAAAVADAALNQFKLGHISADNGYIFPSTFVDFIHPAIVVETIIRSDAWAALQRSLSQACE